ncbi:MAG: AAA family ATPase [Lentisphaeria bacterium]
MTPGDELEVYQQEVWRGDDLIEVRPLPPASGVRRWVRAVELFGLANELATENQSGANLYAGIMPRTAKGKGTDKDVGRGHVAWADFDGITPERAGELIRSAGMPEPTLVVNSGHGTHAYWGLNAPEAPAALCPLVGDLAALLGSDPTVRNPSRILRLPGFVNHKHPAAPCSIVARTGRRYDFRELRALVPCQKQEAPPVSSVPRADTADRERLLRRAGLWTDKVPGVGEGTRNSEAFRVSAALTNDFGLSAVEAWPLLAGWNARNVPPLPEVELRECIKSGQRHHKYPAGCKADAVRQAAPPPRQEIRHTEQPAGELALDLELAAELRGERRGIALPWDGVSWAIGGFRPGTVVVLGGPPGYGKSLFVLQIVMAARSAGFDWRLLPMEGNRAEWERRALTFLANTWSPLADDKETAAERIGTLDQHRETIRAVTGWVADNPRMPVGGEVPELGPDLVLDWVRRSVKEARLVAVDPLAQIDFGGYDEWKAETAFIRRLVGIASDSQATILLVVHSRKRPGTNASVQLTTEDLQGAAAIGRLVHTVMLLDRHPMTESEVYSATGPRPVNHDRTLIIGKTRHGPGHGGRYALACDTPRFVELGLIVPKRSRRKTENIP